MGFLQQFFQNVFQQSPAYSEYAAEQAQRVFEAMEWHLAAGINEDFAWTEAVRPSGNSSIVPRQGYRHDVYRDAESGREIPVIIAAASREVLFPLFIQLIKRLGDSLDVVLESSHDHSSSGHVDFYREQIDAPVLLSTLMDFEEFLTHDGCTGIAVLNPEIPQEVQFDEHKMLIIYGSPLEPFEHLLEQAGVRCVDDIEFITDGEHVHCTTGEYQQCFEQLRNQLGIDADFGSTSFCEE